VAICHYNRLDNLEIILEALKDTCSKRVKLVVCDDGSDPSGDLDEVCKDVILIRGPNKGVAANKNRALWALQDMDFICILEDDLKPIKKDWVTLYEKAAIKSGIHHFCRVQDKLVGTLSPEFDAYMVNNGLTPIYGPSPRGDLTFISAKVIAKVGGFNKKFKGAGYAHGEWSARVNRAGLIGQPNVWVDIKAGADSFVQVGDTTGGRWDTPKRTSKEIERNRGVRQQLDRNPYIYDRLELQ
jgi:glycosyltransferase involved in cell wall biosynthesis